MDINLGLREIVGVVQDVKHSKLDAASVPEIFLPLAQRPVSDMTLVVRTQAEPAGLIPALQSEVRALDPDQPLSGITTMSQLLANSISQPRFHSRLVSFFAAVALLLAAVGIYGVIACSVGQRSRAIGIRMALGAQRRDVLSLVLRQGMSPAGAGIALGLSGAFALTRLLRTLLFGVGPTDPVTFVVTISL